MPQGKRPPPRGRTAPARRRQPARQPSRQQGRGPAGRSGADGWSPAPLPFLTPGGSPFRHAVERRSAVFAIFLRSLPRAVPPLVVIGLTAAGLLGPPAVGGVLLLLVALLLGWLAFLSWPAVPVPGRAVRVGVALLVAAYAVTRFAAV